MKVKEYKDVYPSKWLTMKKAIYLDKNNEEKEWDFVSRNNNRKVVDIICKNLKTKKYLLIKEFRVPINKTVISFPAGLMDENETPEESAKRELNEETGYKDVKIDYIAPLSYKSPGLTDECTHLVFCSIKHEKKEEQKLEASEEIEILWLSKKEFREYIKKLDFNKYALDTILAAFMLSD